VKGLSKGSQRRGGSLRSGGGPDNGTHKAGPRVRQLGGGTGEKKYIMGQTLSMRKRRGGSRVG